MRKLIKAESGEQAWILRWYLESRGIRIRVDDEEPGDRDLWLVDEEQAPEARALLDAIEHHEHADHIREEAAKARKLARKSLRQQKKAGDKNYAALVGGLAGPWPVTLAVVVACVVVFLFCSTGSRGILHHYLLFSVGSYDRLPGSASFSEIARGEVWRLVSPVFLHGNWLHMIFNMLWIWQLGTAAEDVLGKTRYVLLMILIAAVSNTGFYLVAGPAFLGISGVNYGLCGWLWGLERFAGRRMPAPIAQIPVFFLVWYLICLVLSLSGLMKIANTVHGLGAFVGILAAFAAAGGFGQIVRRLRFNERFKRELLAGGCLLAAGVLVDYLSY